MENSRQFTHSESRITQTLAELFGSASHQASCPMCRQLLDQAMTCMTSPEAVTLGVMTRARGNASSPTNSYRIMSMTSWATSTDACQLPSTWTYLESKQEDSYKYLRMQPQRGTCLLLTHSNPRPLPFLSALTHPHAGGRFRSSWGLVF